ncbi:secreted protein containing PEP-CTERM bacterial domain protein [Rhodopirellula sp. SWK7]|nr:secreted protein containing PEP-CTERM bacterial domain protein [Rhodopirellula sp. SWK7]
MKRLIFALAMLPFVFGSTSASAGILPSLIAFDALEDKLLDQGVAEFEASGLGVRDAFGLTAGDVFYGVVQIDSVDSDVNTLGGSSGTVGTLGGAYAFEIDSAIDGLNGSRIYNFKNSTVAGFTLKELLGPTLGAGITDSSHSIAVLSNSTATPPAPQDFSNPPGLANFDNGAWSFEAIGTIDVTEGDFYQVGLAPDPFGGTSVTGRQRGGFSIVSHDWGISTSLIAVSTLNLMGASSSHDFVLDTENATVEAPGSNGWDFASNGNFRLNAVPEPTSIVTMLGVVGTCGLSLRRRRKNA